MDHYFDLEKDARNQTKSVEDGRRKVLGYFRSHRQVWGNLSFIFEGLGKELGMSPIEVKEAVDYLINRKCLRINLPDNGIRLSTSIECLIAPAQIKKKKKKHRTRTALGPQPKRGRPSYPRIGTRHNP